MAKVKNTHQAADGEVVVQLATRVPKDLYRELKLFSVTESRSISDLVSSYIRAGLKQDKPQRKARKQERDDAAA